MTTSDDHRGAGARPAAWHTPLTRRNLFVLAGGAALVSACGGGSDDTAATTTGGPTTTAPRATTTTLRPSTTTSAAPTTTVAPTTVAPGPVQPLTGLPLDDPSLSSRVAVVVKVSNDKGARPQTGLNDADIVFEAWGAGPTRFATVFHSRDAEFVGPIRSCREQDVNLVGEFNRAVFVCSGGNAGNVRLLRDSDMLLVTEGQGPGWRLDPNRGRPHKTHADIAALRTNAGPDRTAPAQQFPYRAAGEAATAGDPMTGFDLQIQQVFVQWRYDPAFNTYVRAQDHKPHTLADGNQVTSENVVVAFLDYNTSSTDRRSPDGVSTGTGLAVVFTGGRAVFATWTRGDRLAPFAFADADGAPVPLTPGRTFIELPNSGNGNYPGSDEFTPVP
jgi:hypothetical protein